MWCEDEKKMWRCEDVKMWGCEDVKMRKWEDVKMRRCEDECEDGKMWRWEDVKMSRCEDEKMWRCEDVRMWGWEDVKIWRCEDEKMWRCEDVKMWGCEDEKMWRFEHVNMFDRPPLLEEPFAKTLSGKTTFLSQKTSPPSLYRWSKRYAWRARTAGLDGRSQQQQHPKWIRQAWIRPSERGFEAVHSCSTWLSTSSWKDQAKRSENVGTTRCLEINFVFSKHWHRMT